MALVVATHNGPFHADDVLSFALVRTFVDPAASVVRTRDKDVLAGADMVFDVGGDYEPDALRFDHHQASYQGPLSSAGMVLAWLKATGKVDPALADFLNARMVLYVDDVDNGRVAPKANVPCFTTLVDGYNRGCSELSEFDTRFLDAARMAADALRGLMAEHEELVEADAVVGRAMADSAARGSNLMELPRYVRWKSPYFARGGQTHVSELVMLPGMDGSHRVLAIPPVEGSFAQKRSLPEAWAGLTDEALTAVCGVPGARFCHKNRFIAVFDTRAHLLQALMDAGMISGEPPADPRES